MTKYLRLHPLLTQGAVFHEVANLSTDATAAIIGSHFSFSKYFRIKEILLGKMQVKHSFSADWIISPQKKKKCNVQTTNTDHLTGIHRRKVSDGCAKHSSAIDKSLHDEICHCFDDQNKNMHILSSEKCKKNH